MGTDQKTERMRRVLWYLHQNPAATHSQIGSETDLREDQVKHLIQSLKESGHLRSGYTVDLAFLGYPERYRIDLLVMPNKFLEGRGGLPDDSVKIDSQKRLAQYIMKELPLKERFKDKVLVEDVRILLGHPADLSAAVRAKDRNAILDFVTEGLRRCRAVYQTSTCQEAWSCLGEF